MSWAPINLADPAYGNPPEQPITCGLLYRAKRVAISGPSESIKTLLAGILGLEHMRGGHGTFAIADFEMDPSTFGALLRDLGATPDEIGRVVYVNPPGPPEQADLDMLQSAGVTLVFIDAAAGAYAVSGLDDNKRLDVETFAGMWVDPLWRLGIATVVIDHVVKNADGRGRYAIGSERKLGGVDVHLGLETLVSLSRGGHGLVRIRTHKDRPGWLTRPFATELEVRSDPQTHALSWAFRPVEQPTDGAATDLPPAARKLLEALTDADSPQTSSQLVDRIVEKHGHGLKRETVSRNLNQLARDGAVICTNPDAAITTPKLWQLAAAVTGVTDVRSRVTSHRGDSGVIDVTPPLIGVTRHGHDAAVTPTPDHDLDRLQAIGDQLGLTGNGSEPDFTDPGGDDEWSFA